MDARRMLGLGWLALGLLPAVARADCPPPRSSGCGAVGQACELNAASGSSCSCGQFVDGGPGVCSSQYANDCGCRAGGGALFCCPDRSSSGSSGCGSSGRAAGPWVLALAVPLLLRRRPGRPG